MFITILTSTILTKQGSHQWTGKVLLIYIDKTKTVHRKFLLQQFSVYICLKMEDIEGVEDICASLGLGHVPLLNAENRELNRQLQELQV